MGDDLRKSLKNIRKTDNAKFGLLCIDCLLSMSPVEGLNELITHRSMPISDPNASKLGIIEEILEFYGNSEIIQNEYKSKKQPIIDIIADDIIQIDNISRNFSKFDFISKSELLNVFADYCADLKINVYQAPKDEDYQFDLYLTKKTPLLITESVIISTGVSILDEYERIKKRLHRASEISDWKIFVTTPLGVLRIGLKKIIEDMKDLEVWLYVVDPVHKRILGLTKASKSKLKNENFQNDFIRKLPSQPIRASSQVVNLSTYDFSEKDSYNPKNFQSYFLSQEIHEYHQQDEMKNQKIFRSLLVISKESGLTMFSMRDEKDGVDDVMISGFLSALDSFVKELSGSSGLNEIDYQDFKISAVVGDLTKIVVITTESLDPGFKERLSYYRDKFEEYFRPEVQKFISTGNRDAFENPKYIHFTKEILLI